MPDPMTRRAMLLDWLARRPPGLSTQEIVTGTPRGMWRDPSGFYSSPYDRASRDLRVLLRAGKVRRLPGRIARWEVVSGV